MSEIEERIGLEIYQANKNGEIIYFSKLIDRLAPLGITKNDIDRCLDKMSDICMTDEKWETLDDDRWVHSICITKEYIPFFVEVEKRFSGV